MVQATRLLDTKAAPPACAALARVLASSLDCPVVAITLVDETQVHLLVEMGLGVKQASRLEAFSSTVVEHACALQIDDASMDERFKHLPLVTGPTHIRAYIGVPLMVNGHALGSLCAMDRQARHWQAHDLLRLQDIATAVAALINAELLDQRVRFTEDRIRTASQAGIEAEQEARRADQLLRRAIDAFHISVVITDTQDHIVLANQTWKTAVGDAYDATTGDWYDTLRTLIRDGAYPDAIGREDAYLAWRKDLHEQAEPQEVQFREKWLLIKDHQLPDGSVVHFAMDISQSKHDEADRKLATEKMRVSEELYRSVAATISDGLVIVELSGRVVAMNPAASRILGVSSDELINLSSPSLLGLTLLQDDLVTPLPVPEWPISQTLAHGQKIVDRVNPLRRPDGEIVWVQTSSHLLRVDGEAPPFAAMVTLRDISSERHAQQELQLSEERWKFALEGAGDGVWDWDLSCGRVYFSQRWKTMLGYEDSEIQDSATEFLGRIHPADRDQVSDSLMRHFKQGEGIHQIEFRLQHKAGHYLSILSRGKIVSRERDGSAQRVVGTHSDITPVKQAERALREKQSAEAASAAKSGFLSRMSHEIRTPLNAVHGFAQLMQLQLTQHGAPGSTLNYVEQILHASHHLMDLVNDVLDLQQVEAGVVNFKPAALLLTDEVKQCMAMLSPLADQSGVSLVNKVTGDWHIVSDRQRLRQVIMNIGSNAIKYNQAGGSVRVDVRALPDGRLALTIEDTGPGMTPRQLSKLFQPFERLGRETSNIEGTGLGLIITRSLIEAMGGSMDIQSQPGVGTQIGIVLPGAQPVATAPAASASGPSPTCPTLSELINPPTTTATPASHMTPDHVTTSLPPLRVLYVEDNRINALLFEEALRPYPQIDLDVAEDGQMALTLAREHAPDVLVLDAHLPGMSGFDVLQALRKLPEVAGAPAFMCSADAMPEDVARAKAAGFTGYWTKPIDIVAVTEELCRLAARGDNAAP